MGLDDLRLHDLRHYVATQLLAAGVDLRTVSGRLGHSKASTTLNVYASFVPDADRQAAAVMAELVTGGNGDVAREKGSAGDRRTGRQDHLAECHE